MNDSIFVIYKYLAPNGKAYIGQTNNIQKRMIAHRSPNNGCFAFANAIKKYGWDNFTQEILEAGLTLGEANSREVFYIAEHNTISPHGYNLCSGGNSSIPCAEARARMSASHVGKPSHRKGTPLSDEQKAKISVTLTGRPLSEERRAKLRIIHSQNPTFKGKKHTEESKAKMSVTRKGIHPPNKGIPMLDEQKAKLSAALKGRPSPKKGIPMPEEQRLKRIGIKRGLMPDEWKAKISAANKGRQVSAETRAIISAKVLEWWRLKKLAAASLTKENYLCTK